VSDYDRFSFGREAQAEVGLGLTPESGSGSPRVEETERQSKPAKALDSGRLHGQETPGQRDLVSSWRRC